MAKIMQNGKCYGSDNSKDIRYDNTNSNMKATNTQDAIDELNSNIENKMFQYRLQLSNDVTLTSTNEIVIPLSEYWSSDTGFKVNSDGTITYNGNDASYVIIAASLYFYTGDEKSRKTISVYRNNSLISSANIYPGSDYITLNSPTVIHNLFKGDILKLTCKGANGDLIKKNSAMSQMSIMGYTSEYLANKS